MSGNTGFDPTGEKKARKKATLRGAILCGIFNIGLGVVLAFGVLSLDGPQEYKPKPDAKTGKIPPPPAGLIYWAGAPGGDLHSKEALLLVDKPGSVTVSEGELNAWAEANFKPAAAPKPVAKPAAAPAAKPDAPKGTGTAEPAKSDTPSFGLAASTPNFRIFKDDKAPADVPFSVQIALPMTLTVFGLEVDTVYQARGVFVSGAQGPEFKPYMSYLGSARIPGPLAEKMFDSFAAKFAASDAAKKYVDAWTKLASANVQEGAIVLVGK